MWRIVVRIQRHRCLFDSAPPTTIQMETQTGTAYPTTGEIFRTDFTGDGTVGRLVPWILGRPRPVRSRNFSWWPDDCHNQLQCHAGRYPTPAGLALVGAGLFTTQQLYQLGGVKPYVQVPGPGQIGNAMFREVSMILAWPINITERFSIRLHQRVQRVQFLKLQPRDRLLE